jgi:hypothetical protein
MAALNKPERTNRLNFHSLVLKLALLSSVGLAGLSVHASVEKLKVSSLQSLEKCYQSQPYELETKINDKSTTKAWVSKQLIAEKCTSKAIEWAQSESKNASLVLEIAEMVRRYDRHEEALGAYNVLLLEKENLSHCENSKFYSTLISALSHPENFPSQTDSDVLRARKAISLCWPQKDFQKDILDEVETDKPYVTDNLCHYFRAEKLNLPAKCRK